MIKRNESERGSALMLVTIIVLILVGISGAYTSISWYNSKKAYQDESAAQALYIAEAGAAVYINELNALSTTPAAKGKQFLAGGFYWVPDENIVDFGNATIVGSNNLNPDFWNFQVAGNFNGVVRRVDVMVTHKAGGVFWNAIFAGNKGGDKNYTLNLTGSNVTGRIDTVLGDIYTGGNINANGDAQLYDENGNKTGSKVTFKETNTSTVTGPNYTNGTQPDLSIPRTFGPLSNMTEAEYNASIYKGGRDSNGVAWIDVAADFNSKGVSHKWVDGSTATDIMDKTAASHIFRKNPSSTAGATYNRTGRYEQTIATPTVKNSKGISRSDYYIEDPTNTVRTQPSLTGVPVNGDTTASMINVPQSGNNAVYYIDGNMRVSGEPIKSYQLKPQTGVGDLKMTMIIKGNVSLTDNLLYPAWESKKDTLAIIAIEDPEFPNTTAAQFNTGTGLTKLTPNGVSEKTFIDQYNTRAAAARAKGLNMPDLKPGTNPQDRARASQEYNKIYGSGNVFFGDPGSGTVEHFEAFMYAENTFYATNLDTTTSSGGTGRLEIYGNMTAGNQVSIDRQTGKAGYIPLKVTFNSAIKTGSAPPGLPATPGVAGQDWHIVTWKQSSMSAETKEVK